MNRLLTPVCLCCAIAFSFAFAGEKEKPKEKPEEFPPKPPIPYLSVEDELKSFVIPDGYRMEIVLDENSIKEPVVCAFDGNGRMYVCEMRSYMQDIDATKELTPVGVVSRHESSKRDGKFDKHTIYADKLLLPRMVLPLDDRVLINETDTNDIQIYKDTKNDGVADKKELWFAGGKRGGNLEHQQSGLVWCMDNWMYQSTNSIRLRWTGNGKEPLKENTPGNGGQWGLGQDDFGKMWFCNAGGEKGHVNFQLPIIYGGIELPQQQPKDYLEVYPLVALGDVQGGHGRHRPDLTLNHMTASCGNEIVRVDRLPEDIRGDALICEPVGRLIRRSKVENQSGLTFIKNAYEKKEFIASTDPNFRPINIANGPDGCMYIVDMYRGIIQEGNWTKPGSYLRNVIKQHSLDKNAGRGRIWRLVHKDFQPGPQPRMLEETPAQLVAHLEHPNGWWRETAQKLLVVKGDKSVVPALLTMLKTSKNFLAKMHAIWTLEGLDALEKDTVLEAMKDAHPWVRVAAIRAGEGLMKKGDTALIEQVKAMSKDSDPNVVLQTVVTARLLKWTDAPKIAQVVAMETKFEGVKAVITKLLQTAPSFDPKRFTKAEVVRLTHGETIYRELCFACHGLDGKGAPKDAAPPGVKITAKSTGTTIAPPLSGSPTVYDRDSMLRVLMSGLNGPVANKTYDAEMVPMSLNNSDEWIADVASYVRNSFGNHGGMVNWEDSARARIEGASRTKPWTFDELRVLMPPTVANQHKWKFSASHKSNDTKLANDGDITSRWDTGVSQAPGMWFQIELPEPTEIAGIMLNSVPSANDYPRGYKVMTSDDAKTWSKPIAEGKGNGPVTEIKFNAVKTKFLRIEQTGAVNGLFWSIHELSLFPPNAKPAQAVAGAPKKKLLAVTVALGNRSQSIPTAEKIVSEMAERTGAFVVDFIKQPGARPTDKAQEEKWIDKIKQEFAKKMSAESLKNYDGVIFLNTSGELPLPDKQAFIDWLKSGKAFIGVRGAADTLHEFKPYHEMLGGEFQGQSWNEPVTLRIKDRLHPASAVFPTRFDFTDEILQFKNWSRDDSHPIIILDPSNDSRPKKAVKPGDPEKSFFERGCREDKTYAVAWTREFGNGRVFYTTLGQANETWKDEKFQQHLYGGIKWALGMVGDGSPQ